MIINTTIKDEAGIALAKLLRISSFTDGNDLITQCVTLALARARQQSLIHAIALEKSATVIDETITAYNAVAAEPIPAPPVILKEFPAEILKVG